MPKTSVLMIFSTLFLMKYKKSFRIISGIFFWLYLATFNKTLSRLLKGVSRTKQEMRLLLQVAAYIRAREAPMLKYRNSITFYPIMKYF